MEPRWPNGRPPARRNARLPDTSGEAPNGMLDPVGLMGEPRGAGPPHERGRGTDTDTPASTQLAPPPSAAAAVGMVPHRGTRGALEEHRQRQVARLATIALVRASYGPRADARLVPPGPEGCPRTCPWCHPRAVAS
jgi:hypothetical protein